MHSPGNSQYSMTEKETWLLKVKFSNLQIQKVPQFTSARLTPENG